MPASVLIPAIAAGANLAGQGISAISTGNMNRRNRKFARENMIWQREWALQDWNAANAYNHPSQQMQRLKEAGLNPNLVYENGAGSMNASPIRSSDTPSYEGKAAQWDGGAAMGAFLNAQALQTNMDNTRKNMELTDMQIELAKVERLAKLAGIPLTQNQARNVGVEADQKSFNLGMDTQLRDTLLEAKKAAVANLQKDLEVKDFGMQMQSKNYELHALQTSSNIREAAEKILRSQLERSISTTKLPYEKRELEARIQSTMADAHLKAFEQEMRQKGLTMSDPFYVRGFFKIMDGLKNKLQSYFK